LKKLTLGMARSLTSMTPVRRLVQRLSGLGGLRCVLYHEIAEAPSAFTEGLGVTTAPDLLAAHLEMLAKDFEFVDLRGALRQEGGSGRARPRLLVTFDDAYASIARTGARICSQLKVPAVFFVNGAFVDNHTLLLDNLVTWIVNSQGMAPVVAATGPHVADLPAFFRDHLPALSLHDRSRLYQDLAAAAGVDPSALAAQAAIYVTTKDLRTLSAYGVELGNHTWSHVHCRHLDPSTAAVELGRNQRFLEEVSGGDVLAFSYPYGSRLDATAAVASELRRLGVEAAFLVESRPNRLGQDPMRLYRVSAGATDPADLLASQEVLPHLRRIRDRLGRHSQPMR
jgi:peptidoglycan/xylan/chitin deacetylase (PgdA/CDA1 family)